MKKRLLIWLTLAGLGIAYLGFKYQNPAVIFYLLAGLGAFGVFRGIQIMRMQRADVSTSNSLGASNKPASGLSAQIYAISFILFGTIMFFLALGLTFFAPISRQAITLTLGDSQGMGFFLAGAGFLIATFGGIRIIAGNEAYRQTRLTLLESVADGIYFSIFGVGLLAIGLWLALSPSSLNIFLESIASFFQKFGAD